MILLRLGILSNLQALNVRSSACDDLLLSRLHKDSAFPSPAVASHAHVQKSINYAVPLVGTISFFTHLSRLRPF